MVHKMAHKIKYPTLQCYGNCQITTFQKLQHILNAIFFFNYVHSCLKMSYRPKRLALLNTIRCL